MSHMSPTSANIDYDEIAGETEELPKSLATVLRMSRGSAWKIIKQKLLEEIDLDTKRLLTTRKQKLEYTEDDIIKESIAAKKRLLSLPEEMETEHINKKEEKKGIDVYE